MRFSFSLLLYKCILPIEMHLMRHYMHMYTKVVLNEVFILYLPSHFTVSTDLVGVEF